VVVAAVIVLVIVAATGLHLSSSDSGPPTATVPSLIGEYRDQARGKLEDLGFGVRIDETANLPVLEPIVEKQLPAGGTELPPGSFVHLVVGRNVKRRVSTPPRQPKPVDRLVEPVVADR
jgi:beta-lactam-binding protein with PASTA domain